MRTNWKRLLAAGLVGLAPCGSVGAEEGQAAGGQPPAVDQQAEAGAASAGDGSLATGGADTGGGSGAPSGFGGEGAQAVGSSGGGFGGGGLGGRGGGGQPAFGGGLGSTSDGGLTGSMAMLGAGPGGVGPSSTPGSLEQAISLAMRANPEVQLARAKVDEARAAYNQTRLRIVADLTQIYRQREALQQANAFEAQASAAKVETAKAAAERNEKLRTTGALPQGALQQALDEVRSAELDHQRVVLSHRQKLASFDTQLMLLMGLEPGQADEIQQVFGLMGMEAGGGGRQGGAFAAGMGGAGMPGGMMGATRGAAGGGGATIGGGLGSSGETGEASGGPAGSGDAPGGEGSAPSEAGTSTGGGPGGAGTAAGGASTGGGVPSQAGGAAGQVFGGAGFGGMTGGAGGGMPMMMGGMGGHAATANARPSIPESQKYLREELEKTTALNAQDQPLTDVVSLLKQQHGIEMQIGPGVVVDQPITMDVSGLKLRDMFLLLTDLYPDLCFVVRDYGLLITTREKGMELYGAAIPADLPLLTAPPAVRTGSAY